MALIVIFRNGRRIALHEEGVCPSFEHLFDGSFHIRGCGDYVLGREESSSYQQNQEGRNPTMLAVVRTMLLPGFAVDVQPLADDSGQYQPYVLILRDASAGTMELVFRSLQDFREFLCDTREALVTARQEVQARRARFRPDTPRFWQSTLF